VRNDPGTESFFSEREGFGSTVNRRVRFDPVPVQEIGRKTDRRAFRDARRERAAAYRISRDRDRIETLSSKSFEKRKKRGEILFREFPKNAVRADPDPFRKDMRVEKEKK